MQSKMAGRMSILLILLSVILSSCSRIGRTIQEEIDRGHALFEERRYSEAMEAYSKAETMALKAEDYRSLGTTYQKIAHTYNATGGHSEEIAYLDKALEAFEKAEMPYNALHAYFEGGVARYNFQDYASAEVVFRNTMSQARQAADTLLEAASLEAYAALCLETSEQDPQLAINMLARKANELKCPLTSEDRGILAYAYALTGNMKEASDWISKALQSAHTPEEKAQARFREYQVASRSGDTAAALAALEAVMEHSNSTESASLQRSVEAARKGYESHQMELIQNRLQVARLTSIFIILVAMTIVFALIGYMRNRRLIMAKAMAEEKAETEKYMNIAEELQGKLKAAAKKVPAEKHAPAARFDLLEKLCEQYYVYEGTDNLQGKILKEVKATIDGLREDPKALKGLEATLNHNNGNVVERLREQMPKLKPEDIKLFIFAASGFSSTTISTILEKDKGIVYNRIWRLKGKISSSEAPDKDEFLDIIKS